MLKSELDELIEESFEQAKKICVCEKCYKEKATPLIFPVLEQQKVILISESPYNFPPPEIIERRKFHWTKYFKQDLECFIYCELGPYLISPRSQGVPENIFDFISLIFYPLLKECETKEHGIRIFLDNVYWTHMAKKSLKNIKNKDSATRKCISSLCKEFEKVLPKARLMVAATGYFCTYYIGRSLSDILYQYQAEKVMRGSLLSVSDIIEIAKGATVRGKKRELLEMSVRALEKNKRCLVAFFPNPSPRNIPLLRCFFTRRDVSGDECSLLKILHMEIERIIHE